MLYVTILLTPEVTELELRFKNYARALDASYVSKKAACLLKKRALRREPNMRIYMCTCVYIHIYIYIHT